MNGAVWQGLGMGCVLQSQNGTNIRWMIKGQTVWPHSNRNTVVRERQVAQKRGHVRMPMQRVASLCMYVSV